MISGIRSCFFFAKKLVRKKYFWKAIRVSIRAQNYRESCIEVKYLYRDSLDKDNVRNVATSDISA